MKYDQVIIYYFSGTGNARNAANWIAGVAREKSIKTQVINIDRFRTINVPEISQNTLIGFCAPTHGFNLPPLMLKFITRFPALKNCDVFILNTRAGMKLSKLFLPGLSGLAQIFPALILRLKGFKVVGMQPMDLPSNWLLLHPGLRKKVVDSIYERCQKITRKFSEKLLNGKKVYKALWSLPFDLAIAPIAILYYFIGRFFLAKTLVATNACNQCEICVKQCPVEAIKMVGNSPFWSYKCESCMRCVNNCPQRAIETAQTFFGLLIFISFALIAPLLVAGLKLLGLFDLLNQTSISRNLLWIIFNLIYLLFVFISYRILHYLMRFKFVNKLITYSSLSTYKFWRRYKAPRPSLSSQK